MFLTPLDVRELPDGQWELLADLVYQGNTDRIVVPKGFVTDFASVPRFLWNIVPPYGKYTKAAVLHDFLYRKQPPVRMMNDVMARITREDSDGIFDRTMEELGTSRWRRWVMFKAVRNWGQSIWDWHRANETT